MKSSNTDTVLYYLPDRDPAIAVIRQFAETNHLKVFKADAISDVLAVPYMVAIIDARYITDRLYYFMQRTEYSHLFNGEKLILSGSASIPKELSKYFLIPKSITMELLDESLSSVAS